MFLDQMLPDLIARWILLPAVQKIFGALAGHRRRVEPEDAPRRRIHGNDAEFQVEGGHRVGYRVNHLRVQV